MLKPGDMVFTIGDFTHYYIDSLDASPGYVKAYEYLHTKIQSIGKPVRLRVQDLRYSLQGMLCVVPGMAVEHPPDTSEDLGHDAVADILLSLRSGVSILDASDAEYNRRKLVMNTFLCTHYDNQIGDLREARAIVLDDFPRGVQPASSLSTTSVLTARGMEPYNIYVVNNGNPSVIRAAREVGANAFHMSVEDFIQRASAPPAPFSLLYLDLCGTYRVHLREGLRALLQCHHIWLANRVLIAVTLSKRDADNGMEVFMSDMHKWCLEYGFGDFLQVRPPEVETPLMHVVVGHLVRKRSIFV